MEQGGGVSAQGASKATQTSASLPYNALARARRHIGQLNSAINILSNPFPGRESLTPRERVTLAQIVMGASSKEAARNLMISHRTVEFHRANIPRKLEVKNTAELIHKVLSAKTRR